MFWDAFTWGLGVTLGGSFGLMVFVVLYGLWCRLINSKAYKRAEEIADQSLAALERRNELTESQNHYFEKLVSYAQQLADHR